MIFQNNTKISDSFINMDFQERTDSCKIRNQVIETEIFMNRMIDRKQETSQYEIFDRIIPEKQYDKVSLKPKRCKICFSDEVEIFEFDKHEAAALSVLQYFKNEKTYKYERLERNIRREELRKLKKQRNRLRKIAIEADLSKLF